MFSAGAVPVLVTTIGIELCCAGDRARAQQAVTAGDRELRLADDIERELGLGRGIFGIDLHLHRKMSGVDRAGRTHLELDVLGLAGIDRNRGQLLGAVGLGERGLEILRARRPRSSRSGCGRCRS